MSGLRHGLARQGILSELKLERLDEGAILQILQSLGEPVPSDELSARRLYRATGGNPFFLLETLRAFLESGPGMGGRLDLEGLADLPGGKRRCRPALSVAAIQDICNRDRQPHRNHLWNTYPLSATRLACKAIYRNLR